MNASPLPTFGPAFSRLRNFFGAALLGLCFCAAAQAQVVRPFSLIFSTNKAGDIAIIGNTLHTSTNGAARSNTASPVSLLINNNNNMVRVDVDSDTNTFNSSSADLALPAGGSVLFAKLYWGAGTNAGGAAGSASNAINPALKGQVLLSFNGGPYLSITNTSLDTESSGDRYQGARDITAYVRTNGPGTYQVANVQASTGSNTLAGWSIVLVYADPAAPPRNLSVFDGYAVVQQSQPSINIPVSGFTTPQFNSVLTHIGVVAYEGDSGAAGGVYTGDQMLLNNISLPAPTDPLTPTNDVFNSSITRLGSALTNKNPNYPNQLGFDLKVINANGVLTNSATNATITLTTGGETYYPGAVAFATELYAPLISIPKSVSDVNGGAVNPGDILLYSISVTNAGGDAATNMTLIDPVPANTVYVSNTFQITAGANVGPKSDATGDDQLDFTNGVLVVRLGAGANGTNGGTLTTNQSTAMSFMVRVVTNVLHGTALTNQATVSYQSLVTGIAFANASTLAAVQVDAGIFGRVFEDVNYSGGAGRNFTNSGGTGLANARVELYNAANSFVGSTLTDSGGSYLFSNVVAGAYSIRVVHNSIVSSRVGGGTPGLLPVQTFRTDASSGGASGLANVVGGANPAGTDPGNGIFAGAQSVSPVLVTNNLYTGGVDFGFNFDTVVNTNDAGPGSLRQVLANANALAGTDSPVFLIANGTAAPGLNAAFIFTAGGVATIAPASALPSITEAVVLDGGTQPGFTTTPVVQLSGASAGAGANGLTVASSGSTIRGLAIDNFSASGVAITSGTNNIIGGTSAGAANVIAFNTGAGVVITGPTNVGNQIRRNSIFANGGLGIDLNNNGVTLNDLNDADTGGNTLFNSPVITNALISGANLVLSGYARPGSIIELFIAEQDPTGFGEGRTYLTTVTEGVSDADATSGTYSGLINGLNQGTDNTARFSFTIPLPPGVSNGMYLTATATDASGNTSEFGGNAPVGGFSDVVVFKSGPATTFSLNSLAYTINVTNNGPAAAVNLANSDTLPAGVGFVSASSGGTLSNGVVSWPVIASLAAGARTNYTVNVTAPLGGNITNFASATTANIDPTPGNNDGSSTNSQVITAVTPIADVAVGKSGPATVLAASNLTYTISVTNFGPVTATNVSVVDNLPASVTFVSASGGGTVGVSNVVTWPATTLLSGATTNFSVTVTAPASGVLLNRASASSPTSDPNPTNNVGTNTGAQVTTTVTPQADVAVLVSGPATVLAGASYTYTVALTNFGPSTATNALATNTLPAGVTFVSTTGGGSQSNGVVTWPAITLASGQGTNFTITVTAPPSGVLTNRAAGASATPDPDLSNNNGSASGAIVSTTITPQADVAVGKSGPATVLAGGNLTYTINVTNLGPSTASNVVASDNLPAAALFVSATGSGTLGTNNLVTWPATNLLSGGRVSFTVTVAAPASGSLFNTASASSPTGDPNPTNNVGTNTGAQVTTTVTPQADLAVTVSGPSTVLAGATYTYTVSVTNFGPSVATNALATNTLPAGVTFVSTTGGGSQSGGAVTWPAVTLASGAGTSFTITVTAPPSGVLINTAAGASSTADPVLANNNGSAAGAIVTTTVTPQADVAVGKNGPAGVSAGANFSYTISVTNLGPSTASNVVAVDNLPASVTFVSASSGGLLGGGNIVTWPATTLLSGAVTNFTVTVTAPASGQFTNVASASSPTGDPNPTNNVGTNGGAQVVTTIGVLADVAVTVSGPATVLAGGTYTYTITLTNFGPSVATNALATNNLPGGVVFVSTTGGGSQSGGAVTWPAITLASGAGTNFIITVTAPPSGALTNRAAGASLTPDPDLSNNNGSAGGAIVTTTVTPQADVAVGKSGPATVLAGANLTYTISVTNFGPSTASNVVASDNLPAAATFVSAGGGGTLGASNVVTWPATTLLSGATTNFTVTVTAPASGSLLNRASATSPTGDPNPTNNVGTNTGAQVTTSVTPQADVAVTVSGPGLVLAGATYTYTVSVTNFGPSTATNTLATNTLPAGVTFVSTTGGGSQSGGAVTWPAITLASGAGTNFTITVTSPPSGVLINTAAGASATPDPDLANNNGSAAGAVVTTTVTPQADVAVSKSGPASVLAGANFNYTIVVTNLGPSTASNVVASDRLPAGLAFVSASSGGALGASNIVSWPATTLLSGASATFTVTVTAPPSGAYTNVASATSPTGDPNPTNNVGTNTGAQVTTTVTPQADVAVGKSGPATVLAGANFTYTINVTNFGPSTASNVAVLDYLPPTVTFVSASSGGALDEGGFVFWPVTTLAAGATTNFTITVTAPPSGSFTNVATASSPAGDPNPGNNSSTNGGGQVTTTVTPQADVAVGKSGPATVLAGANFTYTINVTNFGPSTASNVVAADNLPANVTFVSASGGGLVNEGNVVTWPATTLLSGATASFTVTVKAPASGGFVNTASASSPTGDPNPTNNVGTNTGAQVSTTVTPQADIIVTVSGPTNALAGSNITYTITVTNLGPSGAANVFVANTLPQGVALVDASDGGIATYPVVNWPLISNLAVGDGRSFTFTITAPPGGWLELNGPPPSVVTNTASGGSSTPDPNLSNNRNIATTSITPQADVAVGKSGPAGVAPGSNFVYTISITNLGPSTASNVVAADNLPALLTFVSASGGGTLSEGNAVTWPATTLAAGAVTNFTVTVTAPASGTLTNRASASSPTGDPNPGNNSGTNTASRVITTVVGGSPFGLLAAPAVFNPQTGLFEERVTVTNIGLTTVAAVRLNVTSLSMNATFHNPSGTNNGVPYAQYNSPLNPNQTVVFTLEFFVPNRRPFTNTLTAESVLPAVTGTNAGHGINISRAFTDLRLPGQPRFVVEFPTTPGRVYTVLYRDDLLSPWKVATPSVTATANSTQWYDDGPPKTDGPPLRNGSRYYRVIVAP